MTQLIWPWFDGTVKVHCSKEQYDQMIRWVGAVAGGVYTLPDGSKMYDVILPHNLESKARKVLQNRQRAATTYEERNRA